MTDFNDLNKHQKENFLLKDEILHIVESLSVKSLSNDAMLRLDSKSLPERLEGDIHKFRLALQSVIEFACRYTKDGQIDFTINFEGMTPEKNYLLSFDL